MKCYGIAQTTHECYGHGDYGDETRICPLGFYGADGLPPIFIERETAEEFIKTQKWQIGLKVVELKLIGAKHVEYVIPPE